MQRAGRLLAKLKAKSLEPEAIAIAAWKQAVGARLERRTRAARLVRTTLVVEVEDAIWQRQLHAISPHILRNLAALIGPEVVTGIEFRIGVARIGPQMAVERAPVAPLFADEADRIADPLLRRLYVDSRARQTA